MKPQVLLRGEAIVQRLVLKHETDALPYLIRLRNNVKARDGSFTACWFQKSGEDLDRRGFSRSIRSQKAKDLPGLHVQLNAIDGRNGAEFLDQVFHMNDVHQHLAHYARKFGIHPQFPISANARTGSGCSNECSKAVALKRKPTRGRDARPQRFSMMGISPVEISRVSLVRSAIGKSTPTMPTPARTQRKIKCSARNGAGFQ